MAGPNIILTDFPGTSNGDISNGCKGEAAGGKKQDVIIIKLGGSSITDKTGFEALKTEGLAAATMLIKKCYDEGLGVIVVHGAGSFGHPQAKKYQINKGWSQKGDQEAFEQVRYGFAATRCSVLKLSSIILNELVAQGLPATSLSACGVWNTVKGEVTKSNTSAVADLLALGFIAVMHGDGVLDAVKGCNVLSGDTIIRQLAKDVPGVSRIVFLTDVDGVYNMDPSLPGSRLLPHIHVTDKGEIEIPPPPSSSSSSPPPSSSSSTLCTESGSKGDDVTGGMQLKLSTAISIQVDHGGRVPVFISKVGSEASVRACLEGEVGDKATKLCGK